MNYIKYSNKELLYLKKKDPILGAFIDEAGFVKREIDDDVFSSIVSSIIGQQISTKAADTIRMRVFEVVGELNPLNVLNSNQEKLLNAGLSNRKLEYIIGVAKAFNNNPEIYFNLHKLPDEEIIEELIKLKGIGRWTAEMLLIHTFSRMNVFTFLDLGIKRGFMLLHNLEEVSKEDEKFYKDLYSPYGTVASIYLWERSRRK